MKKLLLSILLLLPVMASATQSVITDYQIWAPVNINYAPKDSNWRGFLELQPRLATDATHLKTAIVRPAVGYAVTPEVTVWAGYLMQATDASDNSDHYGIENRAWQGLTWKKKVNDKFIFEVRNRMEERFLPQNSDPEYRWRTRFRGEYLLPFEHWSLIGSEEIFVNFNDNKNNAGIRAGNDQNRAYAGVGYRFNSNFQIESGYLSQRAWGYNGKADQNNHVWMTNFNINF